MSTHLLARDDRAHPAFFWLGAAAVMVGVGMHLPMFIEAASMNFELVGMPIDWRMSLGMALIIGGTVMGWYGLLPPAPQRDLPPPMPIDAAVVEPPALHAEGKLNWAHW